VFGLIRKPFALSRMPFAPTNLAERRSALRFPRSVVRDGMIASSTSGTMGVGAQTLAPFEACGFSRSRRTIPRRRDTREL